MKKLTLILLAISVTSVAGCQNVGSTYKNMVHTADANKRMDQFKAAQNPKIAHKCWKSLAKFEQMIEKKPRFANLNANLLESKLRSSRTIWGTSSNNNPCLALPNYGPAAQKMIARARFIGSGSQQFRGYQNYRSY